MLLPPRSSASRFVCSSVAGGLLGFALSLTSFAAEPSSPPRELFYLSADYGTTADIAADGTAKPNFDAEITSIADGASGKALHCGNFQRLAWSAPGNIYAQRGTLAFFWRAREPVGPTQFPIFRVAYADHSSWDMVWLRIDYNGHGFDAFVTDANLSRTRVSVPVSPFPGPSEWIHLALSWDETRGIRFYVNGKLAAKNETTAVYDTGLDQFGPHSRIISPYQVQSDYNFTRGGDIDEIRIFDRMLDDGGVASLAKNETLPTAESRDGQAEERLWAPRRQPAFNVAKTLPTFAATAVVLPPATAAGHAEVPAPAPFTSVRREWYQRYGWSHLDTPPPALPAAKVAVRKVEIHEAYDQKRWWWKATDGIRETTWPGVYNRSRLPGRNDYFQLPDWDCYSTSGKSITFTLPDEPWNQIEISGSAWGRTALGGDAASPLLFERAKGEQHTVNRLAESHQGGSITFTNVEQEEPISEFIALNVVPGTEPAGRQTLVFHLADPTPQLRTSPGGPVLSPLDQFIVGRFPADERRGIAAKPGKPSLPPLLNFHGAGPELPLVHITIPDIWDELREGLDGIAIDLPAFHLAPTHGERVAFNLQVKDPLWPARNLVDFSFSAKPGEPHTLWIDLRDRLLPPGKPLYLTLASSAPEFIELSLYGAEVRLIFKPRDDARAEHELDRFTQARDAYAMLVEEHPKNPKLNLWVRFKADLEDLLRINPDHVLGRNYATAAGLTDYAPLPFVQPEPALAGRVPLWAFRQTELLGRVARFVNWYIDRRQIENGELGGGISDDVDLTNTWPGVALMGSNPEKLQRSLHALLEAAYANGMFTRGLSTIQTDELHSYEEGINCLAQNMLVAFGSPRQIERAMETTRGVESITGINAAGHRHIRSSYFSGTRIAEEGPWGWSKPYSYLVLHPAYLLAEYNGNAAARQLVVELADGLLAHHRPGSTRDGLPSSIHFATDAEGEATRNTTPWPLFWASWRWTGDRKYLAPLFEGGMSTLASVNPNTLDLLDLRADWTRRLEAGEKTGPTETRRPDGRTHGTGNRSRSVADTHFAWQLRGDKTILANLYAKQIEDCARLEYINTEGSLWIDRVAVPYIDLQRARLGGVALARGSLFPGHVVSWSFVAPATAQSLAILIPQSTPTAFTVIAHNLEDTPVRATMTGWDVAPGQWEVTQGVDTDDDDRVDSAVRPSRTVSFERSRAVELELPAHATSVMTFNLRSPGTPYWQRADLGLGPEDVTRSATGIAVKVHGLGSVPNAPASVVLTTRSGKRLGIAAIPPIAAPLDLLPKTVVVEIPVSTDESLDGAVVTIDPDHTLNEITELNNSVRL